MNAKEILCITSPGDLFSSCNANQCKIEYRKLSKEWHPDTNADAQAAEVFHHITKLYHSALDLIKKGEWERKNFISFKIKNGKTIQLSYLASSSFELGMMYVSKLHIVYIIRNQYKKYFDNAVNILQNFQYRDENIKQNFERLMPKIIRHSELENGDYCLVLQKNANVYPLTNIFHYYSGSIPDKHVAWIISRLNNILCFLNFSGYTHNGIVMSNCFICPESHDILLFGGWWYATKINHKMIGAPKKVFDILPLKSKHSKLSSVITDNESVKMLGKELLGKKDTAPKDFHDWLDSAYSKSPLDQFEQWSKALDRSYGVRKFIKMEIQEDKIYT